MLSKNENNSGRGPYLLTNSFFFFFFGGCPFRAMQLCCCLQDFTTLNWGQQFKPLEVSLVLLSFYPPYLLSHTLTAQWEIFFSALDPECIIIFLNKQNTVFSEMSWTCFLLPKGKTWADSGNPEWERGRRKASWQGPWWTQHEPKVRSTKVSHFSS